MAQNPFDELLQRDLAIRNKQEAPAKDTSSLVPQTLATAARIAPLGLRIGSGVAAAPFSALGLPGMAVAGAIGGGGELVAQLIEQAVEHRGDLTKIRPNLGRVAVEGGISALPFGIGRAKAAGDIAKATRLGAAKGAAIAGAGVAGRRFTSEDKEERQDWYKPANWSWTELAQLPIGGAIGGAIGRKGVKAPAPAPTGPPQRRTVEQSLKEWGYTPEEIEAAATRSEALKAGNPLHPKADPNLAHGLRVAAVNANKADEATKAKVIAAGKADVTQDVRNLNTRDKFIEKGWQQESRNANATEKYLKGVAKETDTEALTIELERMRHWQQTAKNENAREAYERAAANARAVESRLEELHASGATAQTVVSQTSRMQTPDSAVSARTVINAAGEDGGATPRRPSGRATALESKGASILDPDRARFLTNMDPDEAVRRGVLFKDGEGYRINPKFGKRTSEGPDRPQTPETPKSPVAPKPGVFQIVFKDGRIVEAADADSANIIVTAAGPGATQVIAPAKAAKIKGTAGDILEKQGKQPEEPPLAASAATAVTKADTPITQQIAEQRVAENAAVRGTPADVPQTPVAQQLERERKILEKQDRSGVKLSAPLAIKVAQAESDLPESVIARFFPDKASALRGSASVEETPENAIGLLWRLFGRGETTKQLGKASRDEGMKKAGGKLIGLASKVGKEQNITHLPLGSRPNYKHVPKDIRPTSVSAAPIIDAAQPAAAKAAPVAAAKATEKPVTSMPASREALPVSPDFPDLPPSAWQAKPIPPDLQLRIQVNQANQKILDKAGKATSDEANALAAEMDDLNHQAIVAQYPELMVAMEQRNQAAKAALKDSKAKRQGPSSEKGEIGLELLTMLGGGILGGATSDDPLKGALLGAGAGYLGPRVLRDMVSPSQAGSPDTFGDAVSTLGRSLPIVQRGALLSEPLGLAINTILAPWGAANVGAVERMLIGMAKGNSSEAAMYGRALKNLWNPSQQARRFVSSTREAIDPANVNMLDERAEMLSEGVPSWVDRYFGAPGRAMYAGDLTSRGALIDAGVPEAIARRITLTADPVTDWGKGIVNYTRGHPTLGFMQPFSRTAVNIVESGLERVPGLHMLYNRTLINPEMRTTFAESAVRLGIDVAVGGLAYYLGATMDPEAARMNQLQKVISNMAGQYGLVANAAFMMGQASQYGDDQAAAGLKSVTSEIPVPQVSGIVDVGTAIINAARLQPANPEALYSPQRYVPRNILPGLLTDSSLQRLSQYPVIGDAIEDTF